MRQSIPLYEWKTEKQNPVTVRKLPGKSRYRVYDAGRVTARSTTKKKAQAQARLLRGVAHGMTPRRNPAAGWKEDAWSAYDFSVYLRPRARTYAIEANNQAAMHYKWQHLGRHDDLSLAMAVNLMKKIRAAGFTVEFFDYTRRGSTAGQNPPLTKIYSRLIEIKASKAGMPHRCDDKCRAAGHRFRHPFTSKACVYGLPDGSILIK